MVNSVVTDRKNTVISNEKLFNIFAIWIKSNVLSIFIYKK